MKLNVNNEYGKLKKVLMCSPKGYLKPNVAIDFQTLQNLENGTLPEVDDLIKEQAEFADILTKNGTEIVWAEVIPGAIDQMFTRDPFMIIGDKFVVNNMKEPSRKIELAGIKKIISSLDPSQVIYVPNDAIVEGGDVVVHNDTIYVGQGGLRTDAKGLEFMRQAFGDKYDVVPIGLVPNKKGIPMLHLDCAFTTLWEDIALMFPDGIDPKSLDLLLKKFKGIFVNEAQQDTLGTNGVNLGNKHVAIQTQHQEIIDALRKEKFVVHPVNLTNTAKLGGALRCTTCLIEIEVT